MRRLSALVISGLTLVALSGCVPEDFGGTFYVVNDSEQPVYFATTRIAPRGGILPISLRDCGSGDFTLYDKAGAAVVRVQEDWCPGDTLTVRGPGDYTLADSPAAPLTMP